MLTASATSLPRTTAPSDFRVESRTDGTYLLHVRGKMPMDWVSNLTGGLAHNRLSILQARIDSEGGMHWHGHFILKPSLYATAPGQIDYHQLVRSAPVKSFVISISQFELEPRGGNLFLEVQGEDQAGFLGTLLNKLSFYSLFPVRMEIDTISGRLFDRFWLSGAGGSEPSPAIVAVVRNTLQKMTVVSQ